MNNYKQIANELEKLCSEQKQTISEQEKEIECLKSMLNKGNDDYEKKIRALEIVNDSLKRERRERTEKCESIPNYEKLCKELQDQHQSDYITINQLHVTIDTLCDKYSRLRKIHGL